MYAQYMIKYRSFCSFFQQKGLLLLFVVPSNAVFYITRKLSPLQIPLLQVFCQYSVTVQSKKQPQWVQQLVAVISWSSNQVY